MEPQFDALPTPFAWVDLDRATRNCARMRDRARRLGVRLRPHIKTHKSVEGARLQLGANCGPVTVSTLAEARHFFSFGFDDITYAVPVAMGRIPEVIGLCKQGCRLGILIDAAAVLEPLIAAARNAEVVVPVYVEVDCGYGRTGVAPKGSDALTLARAIHACPELTWMGILTHGGHSYGCRGEEELRGVAREERDAIVGCARRLRAEGIEVPQVSLGSTPTMAVADDLEGVTEIRPGNYVFFDRTQVAIGSAVQDDIALRVRSTVIGAYPERGKWVLDAGALALSKDPGPTSQSEPVCYGLLCDPRTGEVLDDFSLVGLSQEHGHVVRRGASGAELPVGSVVDLLPNHSCLTAAAFDRLWVVQGGEIAGVWDTARGW